MQTVKKFWGVFLCFVLCAGWSGTALGETSLQSIKERGELRHLGIPYANFVSGAGDGLSVELMQGFAEHLGVEYRFVPTTWKRVFGDLLGCHVTLKDGEVLLGEERPVEGDIISTGFTVLPWREELFDFSDPTFITQVWLLGGSDSPFNPIVPSGDLEKDIQRTKEKVRGQTLLGVENTCVDPRLYGLEKLGAFPRYFSGNLNELAPAVLKGEADFTILDVPDSLVALGKWPGKIKILGPVSPPQYMACAFRKDAPELRKAFNGYLGELKRSGVYRRLVEKYYPGVVGYFPEFFAVPEETE